MLLGVSSPEAMASSDCHNYPRCALSSVRQGLRPRHPRSSLQEGGWPWLVKTQHDGRQMLDSYLATKAIYDRYRDDDGAEGEAS